MTMQGSHFQLHFYIPYHLRILWGGQSRFSSMISPLRQLCPWLTVPQRQIKPPNSPSPSHVPVAMPTARGRCHPCRTPWVSFGKKAHSMWGSERRKELQWALIHFPGCMTGGEAEGLHNETHFPTVQTPPVSSFMQGRLQLSQILIFSKHTCLCCFSHKLHQLWFHL